MQTAKRVFYIVVAFGLVLGALWYGIFSLKTQVVSSEQLAQRYGMDNRVPTLHLEPLEAGAFALSFDSYDGQKVVGQISLPTDATGPYPVMLGLHAMGRSYPRWWTDSLRGSPTLTHVNDITEHANRLGYAVIALDARYHGERKDPDMDLFKIMRNLHLWGDRAAYEDMIVGTVKDYRLLINALAVDPRFDLGHLVATGYSMGAQMSLLLAGHDPRITGVVSIVPPYLDDTMAVVAPKNAVAKIQQAKVLMIVADDDEHADVEDSRAVFEAIPGRHNRFHVATGGHILPDNYVQTVADWLQQQRLNLSPLAGHHEGAASNGAD
ncbi:dienelactone hydrolase family protein [Aestuariibacter halophilus]|uniref:Dienelactone hydrolase family protein n=1 Tax=Fluctibacter halophilus TaxID=226011 RepID=A0ABS8G7M7_9ALTE|nr:dienelactone hydrolase family protein [Aestuariibacter halophilus]MCC2616582.1 dienelactone hydrolase family protein [Aestuariibacter halophilus]